MALCIAPDKAKWNSKWISGNKSVNWQNRGFFATCQATNTMIYEKASRYTVDSRYLEFDGTMEKIRVNRSSTQEELRRYRKCGLFNKERETTRAKFWRAKTSIACPFSRNDFKHNLCFCCCFFLSIKFFESCETTDNF
jgi:hypothetical protein